MLLLSVIEYLCSYKSVKFFSAWLRWNEMEKYSSETELIKHDVQYGEGTTTPKDEFGR